MTEGPLFEIIQLGALGILGALVILGFRLIRWSVQKWLPDLLTTIRTGFEGLTTCIDNQAKTVAAVNESISDHDRKTARFDEFIALDDQRTIQIVTRLDEIYDRQETARNAIERLIQQNETLIRTIAVPRELIETQTKLFEAITAKLTQDDGRK